MALFFERTGSLVYELVKGPSPKYIKVRQSVVEVTHVMTEIIDGIVGYRFQLTSSL